MVGIGNGGFTTDVRSREMNSGPANFRRLRKLRKLEISRQKTTSQSTATPAKQKTKNYEETNL